jgi:hypothetical protein
MHQRWLLSSVTSYLFVIAPPAQLHSAVPPQLLVTSDKLSQAAIQADQQSSKCPNRGVTRFFVPGKWMLSSDGNDWQTL